MSHAATIDERRRSVSELWLRGLPILSISRTLKIPHRTVRDDVSYIRSQLAKERVEEMQRSRDRSIAVFREVQQASWALYYRLNDHSTNKVGCLNSILAAESRIVAVYESYQIDELMKMAEEIKALLVEQRYRPPITGGGGISSNGQHATL